MRLAMDQVCIFYPWSSLISSKVDMNIDQIAVHINIAQSLIGLLHLSLQKLT
jgi:hypothetical protein